MARIKKSEAPRFVLAEQIVPVPELGGDVLVRAPGLGDRMALSFAPQTESKSKGFAHLAPLLAVSVLDADDQPLYTVKEWEAFGSKHLDRACELWDIAFKLADFNGEQAAKNSTAPTSS